MSNQPSAICYHATPVTGSQASGDNTHRKVKHFNAVPSVYLQVPGAVIAVFFLFLFL
jgi:hypothetical protein